MTLPALDFRYGAAHPRLIRESCDIYLTGDLNSMSMGALPLSSKWWGSPAPKFFVARFAPRIKLTHHIVCISIAFLIVKYLEKQKL